MYQVTQRFLDEIRRDHTESVYAEFWFQGNLKATVPILSGDVTVDQTAQVRRTCSLRFSGGSPELVLPGLADYLNSPLWPVGNEVKVKAGMLYSDGTEELVPMGMFRVTKPTLNHTENELVVTMQGLDRSRAVSRARFTDSYQVASGTDTATAIKTLLISRIPTLNDSDFVQWMKTDGSDGGLIYTTPNLVLTLNDDPWQIVSELAKSISAEVFFDANGLPVLRPVQDPLYTPSSYDYVYGEQATFESITRDLDDDQTYNGVIVVSENSQLAAPIRAAAWDINPTSPTYYDPFQPGASTYGPVPYFYSSQYITTQTQANAVAQTMLAKVTGVLESVSFTSICNYAHEAGDVIRTTDPAIGVDAMYLFESLRFGLGHEGSMSGQTRRRRV